MKILVTGCTGFIGSKLIDLLLEEDHHISCLSRTDVCPNKNRVNHLQHDLSKQLNYSVLPSSLDCIIHLAALMPGATKNSKMFLINTFSTLNLLEYGEKIGIKIFIFVSSGAIYGYNNKPLSEKSPINPLDFYGLSKSQSELLVNYYSNCFSTVILRLFFPYGPGQINGIVPLLTNKIMNNVQIIIYNRGNPKINPIYIKDVPKTVSRCLLLEGQYIFNVSGDKIVSIKELAILIGKYLDLKPSFKYVNNNKITNLIGDNAKMKKYLRITPTITLEQGIQDYLKGLIFLK